MTIWDWLQVLNLGGLIMVGAYLVWDSTRARRDSTAFHQRMETRLADLNEKIIMHSLGMAKTDGKDKERQD